MPPSTQALRVLSENGRGRGTRGVLDWPYPTVLDRTSPGQQHSSEDVMRSDYLASHSGHRQRLNPSPTGKVTFDLISTALKDNLTLCTHDC